MSDAPRPCGPPLSLSLSSPSPSLSLSLSLSCLLADGFEKVHPWVPPPPPRRRAAAVTVPQGLAGHMLPPGLGVKLHHSVTSSPQQLEKTN